MSTLNVNNINEVGGVDAVITAGVLDSGSLPAGSVLQVVRATDTTNRTTTSTSYVDANISVTITPTTATSRVFILWTAFQAPRSGSANSQRLTITDSSNVSLSGAENALNGVVVSAENYSTGTIIGYVEPGTTSAVTYKGRFRSDGGGSEARLINASTTGQLIAIEVGA